MAGRFLGLFSPLSRFVPEVSQPKRSVGFNEKLFWTAMALAIYFIMSEIPLYGVPSGQGLDLTALRIIFASNRGTLMELGIGPIVTAGLILQLLAGSDMIACNFSDPEDRSLFTTASKVFSIIMTGVQASAYVIGGVYGALEPTISLVIFVQLMIAGLVIMLLDELVQKGWGIGSGISLFILAGVAQNIVWSAFAPTPPMQDGKSSGAFIALAQTIMNRENLINAFIRVNPDTQAHLNLPSMLGFFTTIAVFLIVIYLQGIRVELPITYSRYRGFRSRYPIKLMYMTNLPVIFASALFSNVYLFSQILWSRPWGQHNFWVNLLGQYEVGESGQPYPVGGLVYYMISPQNIYQVIARPDRALGYTAIMIAFCIVFSLTWLEVGGLDPRTVARQLIDSGMQIPGFRRSSKPIESVLNRYIPTVAILGGSLVGLIAVGANFLEVYATGTGILLAVGIVYQYYQLLMQERIADMYPALRRFLGE